MAVPAMVMIDFETSGMSPEQGGRVTEVAAVRIVDGEIVDRFVSLINCRTRIPSFITQLTGITQAMVDQAPPVAQVMPQLVEFIGDDYLAAHNASFDEKFLIAESAALGLANRHRGPICSVKLARRVFPGFSSYSLSPLAAQLGVRFSGKAHRAEADAEVAAKIMIKIAAHVREQTQTEQIAPDLFVKINRLSAAKVPGFLQELKSPTPVVASSSRAKKSTSPLRRFRHYKGGIYELVCEAIQESDLTPTIVYRSHNGTIWTRPHAVFFEWLEIDGQMVQRFSEITT
ncbi:MAG: DUF1653 domain-containing protein [Burkholderiales bacterium]|nr:DUF1653 domain-containing protein [Burkholderiales bacterium]